MIDELVAHRMNKPEPSRNSIDDIVRMMQRRRFMVRPSYQRQEVINPKKSSAIIESVILGITLPAIFVFKRENGISEVIDGQQRILTLLGFLGEEYIDEKNCPAKSKNHNFILRNPRILNELNGKSYLDLTDDVRNKICDFQLYIVEIYQKLNPSFDPIDLFIRLNDKPFPIREHSFEMWNSWCNIDIINDVKYLVNEVRKWFYVKQIRSSDDRDRMDNEELIMSLAYLDYVLTNSPKSDKLDIYQRSERINLRIANKSKISTLLLNVTEEKDGDKENFKKSIKSVKGFLKKLKYILLDCDKSSEELPDYLKSQLDELLKSGREGMYFKRSFQDLYFLWFILNDINFEMIKVFRLQMKKEIREIVYRMKNIPGNMSGNNEGYKRFIDDVSAFKSQYKMDDRKIRLTESDVSKMISMQGNKSGISGAPLFLGDEFEIDHTKPLAIGGKDTIQNLNISHKDENRTKGCRVDLDNI